MENGENYEKGCTCISRLPAGADDLVGPVDWALGVGPAGGRGAGVQGAAPLERVAGEARAAAAVLADVGDLALGVIAAGAGRTQGHQRFLNRNTALEYDI